MRALFVAAVIGLVGCTVRDFSAEGFACDAEQQCPSGFSCVASLCTTAFTSDDGGIEMPDGGGPCVPTIGLVDTFEGNAVNAQWFARTQNQTSMAVADGFLALNAGRANQVRFASIRSEPHDLSGKRVVLEVLQMVDTSTNAVAEMRVGIDDDDNYYFLRQAGGILQAGDVHAGSSRVESAATYSSEEHVWWQFRESGGQVIVETSPDGQLWAELASMPLIGSPQLKVYVRAGTEEPIDEPGSLHIDNVNSGSSLCE